MKKHNQAGIIALLACALLAPSLATADDAPTRKPVENETVAQTTCPVMGGKINKKQYVDHDGKRIYVCCPGCIGKIKADPEKYIKKLEDEGVTLDKVQTTCPVMGGKINKKQYVDHDGKRIYVCCPGCIGKIKADPEKYIKKLEDKGIVLDKVPKKEGEKQSTPQP